jgi:Helix-turn-helix domain
VEHRQVNAWQTMAYRGSGDDSARFLKELRQLRDGAGLGPAELAARAHYPYDRIRAAEAGPALPDLPVLSAYVRGCGGTTEEWEERWRSLTSAPTLPLLAARPAGSSTAASAGARIGAISPAADTPDPSIIMAALDRVADEMAVSKPTVWETTTTGTFWETTATSPPRETDQAGSATETELATAMAEANAAEANAAEAKVIEVPTMPTVADAGATASVSTAASGPVVSRRMSPALAWTTLMVLIAVAICVIVALLAIFA